MELSAIQNYLQIFPTLSTAGQPFRDQFPAVAAAGCQAMINLALVDSPDAVPDEAELWAGLGLAYYHLPVEWESPRPENLQAFYTLMDQLQGQMVFVHCARNMRVSSFVYLYRMQRLGQPPAECRLDLEKIWQPNEVWATFIQKALGYER